MSGAEYLTIMSMILVANITSILLAFRRGWRENLRMLLACVGITVAGQAYRVITGDPIGLLTFLPGVWYLPSLYFIHRGSMAQKVFVTFAVLSITRLIFIVVSFFGGGSMPRTLVLLACALVLYTLLMAWQGRRFTESVFRSAGGSWWGYAAYIAFFCLLLMQAYGNVVIVPEDADARRYFYLLPVFAFAGLALFFVTILRTYQKTAADLELTFARQTLNTGRSYYENLTGTLEQVRLLQHDYKHQLAVLSSLAHDGGRREEALRHLDSMTQHYEASEAESFTANPVIDALLCHYAGQLQAADVPFTAQIQLPIDAGIDNYDLCIVLGNLLDNALAASRKVPDKSARYIKLTIRYKAPQVAIRMKNSYAEEPSRDSHGHLISSRDGGGNGTRSIRAVAQKYGGVYENDWKDGTFCADVLLGR